MLLTTISLKGCHSIFCHVLPHQPFGKLLCHHLILCFIFMALGFTVEMFPASSVVLFLDGVHNHKKAPEYRFYFSKLSMKHSTDFYIFFFPKHIGNLFPLKIQLILIMVEQVELVSCTRLAQICHHT